MIVLFRLALCFFKIGLLSFGGGYSALPLIEEYVVRENGWLTYEQYTDLITLSEVTPGPIGINAASFTGALTAGLPGAVAATVGCVIPSAIIVSLLAVLYVKYRNGKAFSSVLAMLRPAVCAVIFTAFVTIALLSLFGISSLATWKTAAFSLPSALIFAAALLLLFWKNAPPILVIFGAGLAGLLLY